MGQVALGLRSLIVRLAIFVVMAALLAWALGGTLLPRAQTVEYDAVADDARSWFWRLSVGGRRVPELDQLGVRWELMVREPDAAPRSALGIGWVEVAGPVVAEDGVWFGGRRASAADSRWEIVRVVPDADEPRGWALAPEMDLTTRLDVEILLASVADGRPPDSPDEVREARRRALALAAASSGETPSGANRPSD